jgi:hypothetical protein
MLRGFPTERGMAFLERRGVQFIAVDGGMCDAGEYETITSFLDGDRRVELVKRINTPGQEGAIYRLLRSQ